MMRSTQLGVFVYSIRYDCVVQASGYRGEPSFRCGTNPPGHECVHHRCCYSSLCGRCLDAPAALMHSWWYYGGS
jgi:hypothetical protein